MPHINRRSASIVLLVVAISVAAYVWRDWYQKSDQEFNQWKGESDYSEIEEGLYLGGHVSKPPPGTRAVLNLCEVDDAFHCDIEKRSTIPDAAPAPTVKWLREQVEFVDTQRRTGVPTYVHCFGGVSRAGMVTTAYLMKKNNWSRDEALAFVRTKRPKVNPNSAFMELLKEWELEKDKNP